MRIQRPLPAALAEALAVANLGGDRPFELPELVIPVVIWPTRERAAELERVLEGFAFVGGAYCAAVAAQYSHVQLWNGTTTRRLILSDVWMVNLSGGVSTYTLRHRASALSTAAAQLNAAAKRLGVGAVSSAEQRIENNAVAQGTEFSRFTLQTAQTVPAAFKEPLVIEPGRGLVVQNETVNQVMYVAWQFTEEVIA